MADAAEECKTIIDIVESAWPYGVPDGTTEECKLMDIFHSALEYLPKLWMRSCCFEEAKPSLHIGELLQSHGIWILKGPPTYKKTWQ